MIKKIKVIPDSIGSEIFFFNEIDLTQLPDPKIVPLFGPNGIGKTTLIKSIGSWYQIKKNREDMLKKLAGDKDFKSDEIRIVPKKDYIDEIYNGDMRANCGIQIYSVSQCPTAVLKYSNSTDNSRVREAKSMEEYYSPGFYADRMNAKGVSEGQSIIYSVIDLIDGLKPGKNQLFGNDIEVEVLLDEIDSGVSLDNIDMMMKKLKNALKKRNNIQVFLSFNSPRILKYFPYVVSMYDGSVKEMHTDEDMLAEIKKNKKKFDKVRKYSNGKPKIFN